MVGLFVVDSCAMDIDAAVFVTAVLLDLVLGEVPARVHPVVWMGRWIRTVERRMPRGGMSAIIAGAVLVGLTAGLFVGGAAGILWLASGNVWVHTVAASLLFTTTFSVRLLLLEVGRVGRLLQSGWLDDARTHLSRLCSRNATQLNAADVGAAAIASGAENTVDSIVAPWLWWLAFGVPGAVFYRAVNTMDAMIGYRGEYERLGRAAARIDDVTNWAPARITAAVMWLVGSGSKGHGLGTRTRALAVARRDASKTPSPNGGWPMAMTAGFLGVRLGKPGAYVLNPEGRDATPGDLLMALRLIRRTAGSAAFMVLILHCAVQR